MVNPSQRDAVGPDRPHALGRGAPPRTRCRSFCFLERGGDRWTVFLVTYLFSDTGQWRGYFSFRASTAEPELLEVRTADLFMEESEGEIDARARGLGRPLVQALLESALDAHERRQGASADARRWFREILTAHAAERIPDVGPGPAELSLSHLRSLYDSYRLDQVAHLIALIEPADFRALVERTLEGRTIDFRARDRFQLAMIVVQELERQLPLPPFEVWVEDYLARPQEYQLYSYQLHREEELP